MKQISVVKSVFKVAPLALAVSCSLTLLSGCSSSDSAPANTTVSGTIVAAPVNGADVSVVDGNGNVVVEAVKTDAAGQYTLVVPNGSLAQDLIIKSTGGTFTDEASGEDGAAAEMYAYVSADSLSNPSSMSVTPGSTIIAHLVMNHGKTKAQAEEVFTTAFGYTPDMSVTPADATTAPEADEDDASTLAGYRAGAFSQLAMDLGLSQNDQFEMFAALAQDLSDDRLDGVDASGAVAIGTTGKSLEADIQNRFSMAMVNFHASGYNMTGLKNNQIGNLPFAKVALTASYKIEYIQIGEMDAMDGKSTFQLKVTDRVTGDPVTGKLPMLMPEMHMAVMNHSTPMPDPAVEEDGSGFYTVTIYYVMASQMMDGMSMGFWDLEFTVGGEVAHLYPTVMMAMPGMLQVRLKGVAMNDQVMQMDPVTEEMFMTGRPYFIFKDGLVAGSGMGLYDFSVFTATRQSMMKFPAIYTGSELDKDMDMGTPAETLTVTVEYSVNGDAFAAAVDAGTGVWTMEDLDLTAGEANEIKIMLTVDDGVNVPEIKTTDGLTQDPGINDFQTFTVTPGMSM